MEIRASPENKEILHQLILKNHLKFDISYKDYLANHLVHALCTLYSLGASKERIEKYYQTYSKRLQPLREPKFQVTDENWKSFICDQSAYPELIAYFREQVGILGIQKSLDKFIPRLVHGFIGGAFHPLIQIGYGVEYNFPQVVAEGLAYACAYYNRVGEVIERLPDDATSTESVASALEILRIFQNMKVPAPIENRKKFPVQMILDDHEQVVIDLICKWKFTNLTVEEMKTKLDDLTLACINVFFGSYNQKTLDFFLAHSLTGLHATRILLPYLSSEIQKKILQINLVGLVGNYWFQGSPEFQEKTILEFNPSESCPTWESVIQKAINCDEEHVMKVIRSLLEIRKEVDKNLISDELLLKSGEMIVNTILDENDWEFRGIGRV